MGMPVYTVTVRHWRLYNDDGGEAASTPIDAVAEDTDANVNITAGDLIFHLRNLIEEDGGVDAPGGENEGVYFQINGAGGFIVATGATTGLQEAGIGNSQLTDGNATTNRATDGLTDPASGFDAGEQIEDNFINSVLGADSFKEDVYALKAIAADLSDADFIDLQFRARGVAITSDQADARITIVEGVAVVIPSLAVAPYIPA